MCVPGLPRTEFLRNQSQILLLTMLKQIIGPQVFRDNDAPKYSHGYSGLLACLCVAIASVLAYGYLCFRENRKRDHEGAKYEPGEAFSDKTVSRNYIGYDKIARAKLTFGCNRTRRSGTLDTYTNLPELRGGQHRSHKRGIWDESHTA